jgi:hypothetical protein
MFSIYSQFNDKVHSSSNVSELYSGDVTLVRTPAVVINICRAFPQSLQKVSV